MTKNTRFTRRDVIAGAGAGVVTLSLSELLFPFEAKAAVPKKGGKVVYSGSRLNSKHKTLKKARHPYNGIEIRTTNTYDRLTWVDEDLNAVPELATKWQAVSDDQKVWEIDIREGVKFHDGRDMTADDVVASYNLHKDKKKGTSFSKKMLKKIEKIGSHKVRFFLKSPNSEFGWWAAEYRQVIMPADAIEKIGYSGIGTGPFKFTKIDPQRRVVYEANENYWGEGPYLDTLECILRPGMDPLPGYMAGQFDVVMNVDPARVDQLEKLPDTVVEAARTGAQMLLVLPKYEGSPFMDKRVRKALTLAIDREAILRIVYGGKYGWTPNDTHMAAFNEDFLAKKVIRDIAQAKRLLAEAGYPGGIKLPTLYYSSYYPEIDRVFQVASESVKDAGITMPIEKRPISGYRKWRVEDKKKTRKHRFAMGPVGPRNPGANMFRMARPTYNESGYWHPSKEGDRYIALYKKAMVTGDRIARRKIFHEMQRILQDEVPTIFLIGRRTTIAYRKNVHGLKAHSQQWSMRFNKVWKS